MHPQIARGHPPPEAALGMHTQVVRDTPPPKSWHCNVCPPVQGGARIPKQRGPQKVRVSSCIKPSPLRAWGRQMVRALRMMAKLGFLVGTVGLGFLVVDHRGLACGWLLAWGHWGVPSPAKSWGTVL